MYVLYTDSDCDITPELARKYGYKKIMSMPYSYDGKTVYPYEDFEVFDYKPYYDMLRSGVIPTTSAISVDRYIHYIEDDFAAGNDILYVHLSPMLTATINNLDQALEILKEKYPERKLYKLNTKAVTTLSMAICEQVGKLYLEGKSPEEILKWADAEVNNWSMYFFVEDLKFFKKSGRVGGLTATMGSILGIRPIIYMSPDGKMENIGTARGRKRAIEALLEKMDKIGDHVTDYRIYVGHTDGRDALDETVKAIREKYGEKADIEVQVANPTLGAHSGPDGIAVCFHSKGR